MSKKTSFKRSAGLFVLSLILVLSFRWIGFEPFVIPSGSMIPTLLINDHILVSKYSFGIRLPFSSIWIVPPKLPKRGDVVVFRSVEKDDYYMIKRVVGLPGDKIQFSESGDLTVNGELMKSISYEDDLRLDELEKNSVASWTDKDLGVSRSEVEIRREKIGSNEHFTMLEKAAFRYSESGRVVPEGRIFLMGDNRDRSRDSRFWGELPIENLLGQALFVWLSCSQTALSANFVCDPRFIRWQRFFHQIE